MNREKEKPAWIDFLYKICERVLSRVKTGKGGGGRVIHSRRNSATICFSKCNLCKKFPKTYISGLVVHAAADGVALGAAATTNQGAGSQFKYYSSYPCILGGGPCSHT